MTAVAAACTLSGAVGVDARGGHEETIRGFGLGDEDVAAWRTSGLTEDAFVDWLTDRVARRPSGLQARQVYGADDVHEFARRAILDALALGSGDHVLDVGCGGGLLLRDALAQGARATGLDHSEEMVALARERAPGSTLVLAEAGNLPFEDETFSAIAMSIVFFFLADPVQRVARVPSCSASRWAAGDLHDRARTAGHTGCARTARKQRPLLR